METPYEWNRRAWDDRARRRLRHTRTVFPEHLRDALRVLDPEGWLEGPVAGRRALCLGAGGGLASALFAAAGAETTVVDISGEMLRLDEEVAARHGLAVRTVRASMDNLAALPDAAFDCVLQPVSTCYVPEVGPVFREVARVLRPGGIYVSQHKQPANLQADAVWSGAGYLVREPSERDSPLPPTIECVHREADTLEYLHTLEALLGGLCRAGFAIEDLREPRHGDPAAAPGEFGHRSRYIPPYMKLKARRRADAASPRRLIMAG